MESVSAPRGFRRHVEFIYMKPRQIRHLGPLACRHSTKSAAPVALLVETSFGSGRVILTGIARYVREHEPWLMFHEARSIDQEMPRWLKNWKGEASSPACSRPRWPAPCAARDCDGEGVRKRTLHFDFEAVIGEDFERNGGHDGVAVAECLDEGMDFVGHCFRCPHHVPSIGLFEMYGQFMHELRSAQESACHWSRYARGGR